MMQRNQAFLDTNFLVFLKFEDENQAFFTLYVQVAQAINLALCINQLRAPLFNERWWNKFDFFDSVLQKKCKNNARITIDNIPLNLYNCMAGHALTHYGKAIWRDGWAGLRRTTGNRVMANTHPRVRIPLSPPHRTEHRFFEARFFRSDEFAIKHWRYRMHVSKATIQFFVNTIGLSLRYCAVSSKITYNSIHQTIGNTNATH